MWGPNKCEEAHLFFLNFLNLYIFFGLFQLFHSKNGRFWAKHPIFLGGRKSFGTKISENYQAPHPHFFGGAWHQLGQIGQYANFRPHLAVFGPKILIFGGGSKSFGTYISENNLGTSTALLFGWAPMGRYGQNVQF